MTNPVVLDAMVEAVQGDFSHALDDYTLRRQLAAALRWLSENPSNTMTKPVAKIAHTLWYRGSRMHSELLDALVLHPENWHEEGLKQMLAQWDEIASTYASQILLASKLAAPALPESAPAATAERELPPNFCCIKEPDNPDFDEKFECKDCGENFITMCSYVRLKRQLTRAQEQIESIAAQANRLNEEKNAAEQQIAALQGRIEEADGFLRDQLAWCPCDEIHSDPPCDRCKRVAKWLTAPIAPEKEG